MWRLLLVLALLAAACGSNTAPTPAPSPIPTLDLPSLPLDATVAGIPALGAPSVEVESLTPAGSVPVGVEQNFNLGHCGLISPIDVDGSLWDPVAGDDGSGGPLTQGQLGELINPTAVVLVLVDHDTALFETPLGARILLTRHEDVVSHEGPRRYSLCD